MSQAVTTSLVAHQSSSETFQDRLSTITLNGFDVSLEPRDLSVQVTHVPSAGTLYPTNRTIGQTPMKNGDYLLGKIIKNQYENGLKMLYKGSKYYFNSPSVTANGTTIDQVPESVMFRVSVADGSTSPESAHTVVVRNVNDPTEIDTTNMKSHPEVTFYRLDQTVLYRLEGFVSVLFSSLSLSFLSLPLLSDKHFFCLVIIADLHYLSFSQGYSLRLPAFPIKSLTISGIKLVDHDRNVDKIRAHIVASIDIEFSLNSESFSDITTSCSFESWNCQNNQNEMVFLGTSVPYRTHSHSHLSKKSSLFVISFLSFAKLYHHLCGIIIQLYQIAN